MALVNLDKTTLGGYMTAMWKRQLGTTLDPSNGKWTETKPGGKPGGLVGRLTDTAATELILDKSQQSLVVEDSEVNSAIVDNTNGLLPESTVTLRYTHANSTTTTHSTTSGWKLGVKVGFEFEAGLVFEKAKTSVEVNFEGYHSWTDSTSTTESKSIEFSQEVPVRNVPKGRVYKAVLVAQTHSITIPYRALISVSGQTETWFAKQVKKHYCWISDAGTAFARIAEWGLAGAESHMYGRHPKRPSVGVITQSGSIAAKTVHLKAQVYDVTDVYEQADIPAISLSVGTELPSGKLIEVIDFDDAN